MYNVCGGACNARARLQGAALLRRCERPDRKTAGQSGAEAGRGKMAAAAVAEFQRAQSLLGTDRNASIDILHSIGKYVYQSAAWRGDNRGVHLCVRRAAALLASLLLAC